jgi:hypothetical protein
MASLNWSGRSIVVKKYLLDRLILNRIYQSQGLRELVADLVDSFD